MKLPKDEELFPCLQHSENGTLSEGYCAEVSANLKQYVDLGSRCFTNNAKQNKYEDELDKQIHRLWEHTDIWLEKKLDEGQVDSFPRKLLPLFSRTTQRQHHVYDPDDDEYDVHTNEYSSIRKLSYFQELETCLKEAKCDHDGADRKKDGSPMYQTAWLIYAVGHPITLGDILTSLLSSFAVLLVGLVLVGIGKFASAPIRAIPSELAFILSLVIKGAFLWVGTIVCIIGAFIAIAGIFGALKQIGMMLIQGSYRRKAQKCAPQFYRRLRYYMLWDARNSAVKLMQEYFDAYLKVCDK